jgi:hypothetical protein
MSKFNAELAARNVQESAIIFGQMTAELPRHQG